MVPLKTIMVVFYDSLLSMSSTVAFAVIHVNIDAWQETNLRATSFSEIFVLPVISLQNADNSADDHDINREQDKMII